MSRNAISVDFILRYRRWHFAPVVLALFVLVSFSGCGMLSHGDNASGVHLYHQGNYDGAAQRFQQAIVNSPNQADGYYNLAATLHQRWKVRRNEQDLRAAEDLYAKCLDRDGEHRECHRGLAVLLIERGDPDAAFRLVNGWASRSIAPAEAKVELARLYTEFKDPEEAQKRIVEALEMDPYNDRALKARALAQEQAGDYQQAMVNYARSMESNRFQPDVSQRIAALQGITGSVSPTIVPTSGTRVVTVPDLLPRY